MGPLDNPIQTRLFPVLHQVGLANDPSPQVLPRSIPTGGCSFLTLARCLLGASRVLPWLLSLYSQNHNR